MSLWRRLTGKEPADTPKPQRLDYLNEGLALERPVVIGLGVAAVGEAEGQHVHRRRPVATPRGVVPVPAGGQPLLEHPASGRFEPTAIR